MMTMAEFTQKLSDALPDYLIERDGRKYRVNVYTKDKKHGVWVGISKKLLNATKPDAMVSTCIKNLFYRY